MSSKLLNEPVLILNTNFEPIHVCSSKRALTLLVAGKADLVINGRGVIRSGSQQHQLPSIIKMRYLIRRPRSLVVLSKKEILRRDEFTCQYCGRQSNHLTIDHIIPRYLGGQPSWFNLVAACANCNRRKGGRTPEQANMKLRRQPSEPPQSAYYRFSRHLVEHQDWEPYILGW